ncbi:MAG: GNAT family N-acetyltransferase [Mobilicoccus sp.]|nr:GNAT family N-acetyltransferase [Mobilicoccus sp.]
MKVKGLPGQLTRVARAEPEDAFRLAALEIAYNRELGRAAEDGFLDRFTDVWLRERDRYPSWIASTIDGNPLGACTVALMRSLPRPGRIPRSWGHMTNLYVRPEARGLHLGTRLLEEALHWCDSQNLLWVQLMTSEQARSMFTRRGFVEGGGELYRREGPR